LQQGIPEGQFIAEYFEVDISGSARRTVSYPVAGCGKPDAVQPGDHYSFNNNRGRNWFGKSQEFLCPGNSRMSLAIQGKLDHI
jgi:hypothetical protein